MTVSPKILEKYPNPHANAYLFVSPMDVSTALLSGHKLSFTRFERI
jgi:hypothetical protein